ncbi:unnamed protein product [Arabis nemorensis]|uniref:Mediator-associated protein 2 n=1 Tax=Arabis nemorensis TaxID=586526 RepID=A0A565CWB3_9BRAS|nr:unnamed protein product [Arabis nemorensis]
MELQYKPSDEFVVKNLNPLDDNDVTESEELWLIQCPISHFPDIDGKEVPVELDEDGTLGCFEDSSGKEVDFVSFASQEADATVIIPSGEKSEIVGKISRRVSLVRYPEPKELLETMKAKTQQKLVGAVTDSVGKYSHPALSSRHKSGQSKSTLRHSAATRSSRQKSTVTGFTETPMSSKGKHSEASSGKHRSSTTTVSGSSDRSGKSKKKVKTEK